MVKACIFDLDGVIVDTAKFHYQSWRDMARRLGFDFTEAQNEQLKGVSRMDSLDIVLGIGGIAATDEEKEELARRKNEDYMAKVMQMTAADVLPGIEVLLVRLREAGVRLALGSASKNARVILERVGLIHLFDVLVDGNLVTEGKPNPRVFLKAAELLDMPTQNCLVFEDAEKGVEAALAAGMLVIGVGHIDMLGRATYVVPSTDGLLEVVGKHFLPNIA
jgi:beta-phosphoglucomutase